MDVDVKLTDQPIEPPVCPAQVAGSAGAWTEFRGIVRAEESGQPIAALEYEAYAPMALSLMRRIIEDLGRAHPCLAVRVIHRTGVIPVGEAAIYVGVAAGHRAEAFAMLAGFMDCLKQDVPIWKIRALSAPAQGAQS